MVEKTKVFLNTQIDVAVNKLLNEIAKADKRHKRTVLEMAAVEYAKAHFPKLLCGEVQKGLSDRGYVV